MDFNESVIDAMNYVSKYSTDEKIKKAADKAIEFMNKPKPDYSGVQNYISGAKSVNSSPIGGSSLNGTLGGIFGNKNKARDEEIANKKAMAEKAEADAKQKAIDDEENAKADKLHKRKMHQQALVSSRVQSNNAQPQMPSMGM